jgi:hypothetical protein
LDGRLKDAFLSKTGGWDGADAASVMETVVLPMGLVGVSAIAVVSTFPSAELCFSLPLSSDLCFLFVFFFCVALVCSFRSLFSLFFAFFVFLASLRASG